MRPDQTIINTINHHKARAPKRNNGRLVVVRLLVSARLPSGRWAALLTPLAPMYSTRPSMITLHRVAQGHFHQDNASVHNSILVTNYLTKMGIKIVPHPPWFGSVKQLGTLDSHCTKWVDGLHRPAGFETRLVSDRPIPLTPHFNQSSGHWPCVKPRLVVGRGKYNQPLQ